ncbi:MAG TPA: hypothetical protein VG942_07995 [Hyphomonadaceae bacterium]|nr:hypothetical protein [Hyphomonadaceae bacterium]
MRTILLAAVASLGLSGAAMSQTPQSQAAKLDGNSLTWLVGYRVHTNANGTKVFEAFTGPINGVVTGTALSPIGQDKAYTEYHKIGPNAEGVYGLDVANTRSNMQWNFTPLKAIEADRITFQTADGKLTIMYYAEPNGGVGSKVDRIGADGKTTTSEWHFKVVPLPK